MKNRYNISLPINASVAHPFQELILAQLPFRISILNHLNPAGLPDVAVDNSIVSTVIRYRLPVKPLTVGSPFVSYLSVNHLYAGLVPDCRCPGASL